MKLKYVLLILLSGISLNASAQQVSGRVVENGTQGKIGLPGANVYWLGTTKGAVTDGKGNFTIGWSPVGRLVVSFTGYAPDTLNNVKAGSVVEVILMAGQQLEEVSVVKRGQTTVMSSKGPVIEQVITGGELMKAACCNLGESFETNASVDVSYADAVTGAKQIQLLGLTGKYVQMMTENMPNFRGLSSLYGLSYIPGPWMKSISVSKGASSVVHGYEAIAGQISVDYKKPLENEKIFVNAFGSSDGMIEFNTNAGVKLNEKWSTAILAHGDWSTKSHDENHDSFLDMPEKTQYNLMNRWQYKDDTWFLQFGGKLLDEERLGGQHGFKKSGSGTVTPGGLYGIGIDTRRYEGFLKLGYLMPQYENTSMAVLVNYTDHDQDSYYGIRDYDAHQKTVNANYIYQSVFGENVNQKYSAGFSFNHDGYDEFFRDFVIARESDRMPSARFQREENVTGAFFQYTGTFWDQFTVMAGLRYDYRNLSGGFVTPRLHLAYSPDDLTTLKISAGKGSRTANILAENSYLLASAKSIYVNGKLLAENVGELDKLDMEEAWNFGVHVNRKFVLFERILNVNLDYYRTDFIKQVVVDNETQAGMVNFYNLTGDSYSNCYQVEVKYELLPRLDVTGAYRYNDVKMTIGDKLQRIALQSRYKGLLNLSYYTNLRKWQFDFTTQFNGSGRMPSNGQVPEEYKTAHEFPAYRLMNAQVTKFFRKWSIYAGCENIGDFTQDHPIIAADDPWSEYFDSSKIWGPVLGRKFYLGVRFAIDRD